MARKSIYFIIIIICGIIITHTISTKIIPEYKKRRTPEIPEVIIPINLLIDNDMSSFKTTDGFDKEVMAFMRRWEMPGVSFALMLNDSLIYAKGYGYADKSDSIMCNVNNVFRIASASKLITATAIMKLSEQGKLSLDTQVFGEDGVLNDSIFLNLRNKNLEKITVEHLLRHTAGFSSPIGDPAFNNEGVARTLGKPLPITVDDMVVYATRNTLRATPGGRYDYSNLGYIVLSKVIENITGIGYERYIQDSILAPAGCYNMYIGASFKVDRPYGEVEYYEVKEAEPVEAYDGSGLMTMKSNGGNNISTLSGAGGWVASPTELLRFVAAIDGVSPKEDIISRESVNIMTQQSESDKPIGWASITSSSWLRSGSMAGTSALIKRESNGYTWVFLANTSAWIGPNISKYISSAVTRSIAKVKEWPQRDLFDIRNDTTLRVTYSTINNNL